VHASHRLRPPPAVAVGKDAVTRATVGNLARLMDEVVTALARCKQPKLKVGGADTNNEYQADASCGRNGSC
jgi:hypothetical protein